MATPLMCMLYTGLRLCRSTFPGTGVRLFSCGAVQQAGSKWRLEHGMARSNSEYGPFTDLPDWSFADGRPAPPCKGELRRRKEREEFARRVVMLSQEVDKGMETWQQKQQSLQQAEEEQKANRLKPKGHHLLTKKG